ncbi:MAG: winged helix-turn-helix domain-containing protein [Candidatus Thorarchaeota archaeon]
MNKKLNQIEDFVQIINLESCLRIYSYLMLFGKTTPAELRDVTQQSKATMFRNLSMLYDAGLVKKQEVKSVEDKRYSLHYYISKDLIEAAKNLYTKELHAFADAIGKSDLIRAWLSAIEALPFLMNQHTSQMIMLLAQKPKLKPKVERTVVSKFLVFRLADAERIGEFQTKLHQLVTEFDSKHSMKDRDWKKPLLRPVALAIGIVSLNPDSLPTEDATMIEIEKC